jgi:outer membrane protein assembly factor BamB
MRKSCLVLPLLALVSFLPAQQVGDQNTAGYSNERTYFNENAGRLVPPLENTGTIVLPGFTSASSLAVFGDYVLVGQGGSPAVYALLNQTDGTIVWTEEVSATAGDLDYAPAVSNDVVLLGSGATTTVKAIRVSDGAELWEDPSVGDTSGRYPVLSGGAALYHGAQGLVAAEAQTGIPIWMYENTTAEAPVALLGAQAYLVDGTTGLSAVDIFDGNQVWNSPGVAGNGSTIIPTEHTIFANWPADQSLSALRTADGSTIWSATVGPFGSPGIALAYGYLYAFYSENSLATVAALNPDTGEEVWKVNDPSGGPGTPMYAVIADGSIYFYNPASERVRVLDARSGNSLWSISQGGVKGLVVAKGALYVLKEGSIEVYTSVNLVYLAQLADGGGLTTLFAISNRTGLPATGTLSFFDDDGVPLSLGVMGSMDPVTSVPIAVEAGEAIRIQTRGDGENPVAGWAILRADQPMTATSIFQTSEDGVVLFEAGVAADAPSGLSNVLVSQVSQSEASRFSTGVAMANPLDETATIELTFVRKLPEPSITTVTISLPPQGHIARFAEEFFPDEAIVGSEGTLLISSDIPIVVAALRTQNGFQMSSFPAGRP